MASSHTSPADGRGKGWIVMTTINPPGPVVEAILAEGTTDWRVVIVGDKKTRGAWDGLPPTFLSVDRQHEQFGNLADDIPYNHYARKNLGYLYAIAHGAETILETDDDTYFYTGRTRGLARKVRGRRVGGVEWSKAGMAMDLWRALTVKGHLPEKELPLVERWLSTQSARAD